MRIFVDADACPKVIKELLYKVALRTKTELILVANHFFITPISPLIQKVQVAAGFDEADNYIALHITNKDLVITADIPLADIVVGKGALALNPRGQLYTVENIKQQLATRNLLTQLRDSQLISGGPATFSKANQERLANQLDKILTNSK